MDEDVLWLNARFLEKEQKDEEIGDWLVQKLGPSPPDKVRDNSKAMLEYWAAQLTELGRDVSVDTLRKLRKFSSEFPPEKRIKGLPYRHHLEAGDATTLNEVVTRIREDRVKANLKPIPVKEVTRQLIIDTKKIIAEEKKRYRYDQQLAFITMITTKENEIATMLKGLEKFRDEKIYSNWTDAEQNALTDATLSLINKREANDTTLRESIKFGTKTTHLRLATGE